MDVTLDMLDVTAMDELNSRITKGYYEVIHRTFDANKEKIKSYLGDSYTRSTVSRILNRKVTKGNSSFVSESILERFGNETGIHFESLREQAFFLTDVFYGFIFVYLVKKEMATTKMREKYGKYFRDLEDIHGLASLLRRLFELTFPKTSLAIINRHARFQLNFNLLRGNKEFNAAVDSERLLRRNEITEGLRENFVLLDTYAIDSTEQTERLLDAGAINNTELRERFVKLFVDKVYEMLHEEKKNNKNFIITKQDLGARFCINRILPLMVKELEYEINMSEDLKFIFEIETKMDADIPIGEELQDELIDDNIIKKLTDLFNNNPCEARFKEIVDSSNLIKLFDENKVYSLQYNTTVDDLKNWYR